MTLRAIQVHTIYPYAIPDTHTTKLQKLLLGREWKREVNILFIPRPAILCEEHLLALLLLGSATLLRQVLGNLLEVHLLLGRLVHLLSGGSLF